MTEKKEQRWLQYLLGLCVHTFTTGFVLFALLFGWAAFHFEKQGPLIHTKFVNIPRGAGLTDIAHILEKEGAVKNPYIFVFGATVLNAHTSLKAGEYELTTHMSPKDILFLLLEGKVYVRRITIPEGRTSYEIVEILRRIPALSGEITDIPAEGTLFPNTYDYERDEVRTHVLERMRTSMRHVQETLWAARAADLPLKTFQEALILASLVEKETGTPHERARIAGVFINRLQRGMPLQTDPSIVYALTKGRPQDKGQGPLGRRLLSKDLEISSPYNTYTHTGLPPTPIANVGKAALEAALHPEKHDFLYFVADGSGGHVFSKTLAEHNKNVAVWRKIRKDQK